MKLIPLSQNSYKNHGKYSAQVDDEDFEYLNQWIWSAIKNNSGNCYAIRSDYSLGTKNKVRIWMHRLIMKTPIEMDVDHKDRNGWNNQKSNLRNCTRYENCLNRKKVNKTNYKGVTENKSSHNGKDYIYWRAAIVVNKKRIHLGTFSSAIAAALAYNAAAIKHHGEFANINQI